MKCGVVKIFPLYQLLIKQAWLYIYMIHPFIQNMPMELSFELMNFPPCVSGVSIADYFSPASLSLASSTSAITGLASFQRERSLW